MKPITDILDDQNNALSFSISYRSTGIIGEM